MGFDAGGERLVRTFIAVPLPPALKDAAARVQEGLKTREADVKWVAPANFHFTLKFLGEVPASRLAQIQEAIALAVDNEEPFTVHLQGTGAFPKFERPQVIWIGAREGGERLSALAGRVEAAMESLGFPRERRPFTAHLTVGRLRSPKGLGSLVPKIQMAKDQEVGSFAVEKIVLMQSDLRPAGPIYTPIKEFSLGE